MPTSPEAQSRGALAATLQVRAPTFTVLASPPRFVRDTRTSGGPESSGSPYTSTCSKLKASNHPGGDAATAAVSAV